jgi:hypothetical protein
MQEWELAQEKATLESLQALEGEVAASLREPKKEASPKDDRLAVG